MRIAVVLLVVCTPTLVSAGQLGTLLPWISGPTAESDLVLNNDDYEGAFSDNPNRFKVNEESGANDGADVRQSIVDTERIIASVPSGGTTEYALSIGGGYSDSDARPGVNLDSVFQVQLGFGTGDNFVRARDVAPELKFDSPDNVNPAIEDYFFFIGDIPLLKLLDHQGDTLVYQGSSTSGTFSQVNFSSPELFMLPLDLPDLPETVRDFYSPDELQSLAGADRPFTVRVGPVAVPEPSTGLLASLAALALLALRRATR